MATLTPRRVFFTSLLVGSLLLTAIPSCRSSTKTKDKPAVGAATAPPAEELRGLFVTTSNNTDWPSQAGLHERIQQNEIDGAILRAKELNCNVIFLQVRAWGDRMHWSTTLPFPEPWAQTLNFGHDPKYDPLRMWIRKAHAEGIQLHAWIDPYRTDKPIEYEQGKYLPFFASADGNHLFLDPTSIDVQKHLLRVIGDLVSQYPQPDSPPPDRRGAATQPEDDDGLDGVVVPHNFVDPSITGRTAGGKFREVIAARLGVAPPAAAPAKPLKPPSERIQFLLKKHNVPDPYKPRNDRGASADDFVKQAYELVDKHKLKFGLSPSEEQWDNPHANFKKWLENRWCHYFVPELYLPPKEFKAGLEEWKSVNDKGGEKGKPLLAPALNTAGVERPDRYGRLWDPKEIEEEIEIARDLKVGGQVHFSERALRQRAFGGPRPNTENDIENVGDKVKKKYKDATLLPPIAPPDEKLSPPKIRVLAGRIKLQGKGFRWLVRFHEKGGDWGEWRIVNHKENKDGIEKPDGADVIEAIAIDRHGIRSDSATEKL